MGRAFGTASLERFILGASSRAGLMALVCDNSLVAKGSRELSGRSGLKDLLSGIGQMERQGWRANSEEGLFMDEQRTTLTTEQGSLGFSEKECHMGGPSL